MGLSKNELLSAGGVSNQESLVKKLRAPVAKPVKFLIPGGKHLLDDLDEKGLERAIYNWLRRVRAFSSCTISFAKEPARYRTKRVKITDFPPTLKADREPWEIDPKGRGTVARLAAKAIVENKLIALEINKSGIFILQDINGEFSPFYTITDEDVAAQKEAILEAVELERQRAEEAGEEPKTPEFKLFNVGDIIPSPDWEPYVELLPKANQEYGV